MLLRPRSAAETHYRKLKLDLLDITTYEYYVCKEKRCDFVSFYQTGVYQCGKPLKVVKKLPENQSSAPQDGGCVFVKSTTRFIIDDKFKVRPVSIENGKKQLEELQLTDESKVERKTENMGTDEVLKLMVCSLASKTPFSDIFANTSPKSSRDFHQKYVPERVHQSKNHVTDHNASDEPQIKLTLFIDKPNDRVLYAEAGEDFVDLLFSFLAIPLAYFFKQFPSLPFKGSMKNLYKNIQDLPIQFFESEEMKATLVDSKLAPGFAQKTSQLLHLEEASNIRSNRTNRSKLNNLELGSNSSGKGFVKGPSQFLVKNNLSLKPCSAIDGIMIRNEMNVRSQDTEKLEVTVDKDKVVKW
ncbi:hypothetical protein F0562_020256 [Nyssa sinensis]|uniref:Uncharacterized protein n=1 Tax=Nyssa sinensis TaxID=561372 RepID=A0A5J5BV65_9ASTE|nr:hypothetical protein F0562_020256 [Nyssa sinensis]